MKDAQSPIKEDDIVKVMKAHPDEDPTKTILMMVYNTEDAPRDDLKKIYRSY